jgi:PhnB protein
MKAKVKRTRVKPIPDGFHSLTPYLIVQGGGEAIAFYKKAFGAKERLRIPGPDGKTVGHAEIVIGDSILMLADEFPGMGKSPKTLGDAGASLLLYVKDVDAAFKRAVAAGAAVKQPVADKFYGERAGCLVDPFGHLWTLMTHIEDVSVKEVMKRAADFAAKMGGKPAA